MQTSTGLGTAIISSAQAAIAKLAAALDALYPSVVIAARAGAIGEPSDGYIMGADKPDFVRVDEEGWV